MIRDGQLDVSVSGPSLDVLFFDVGGVCLTNGWDRHARRAAIERFDLDSEEFAVRHSRVRDAFECGEVSLHEYLDRVVFHCPRGFGRDAFIEFMKSCSQPHAPVLDLVAELAGDGRYRLATINNESRELNLYRIQRFDLARSFSAFFSSCFLGVQKPDPQIYRIATDVMHAEPHRCLFIDDRLENVGGAREAGLRSVHARTPADVRDALRREEVVALPAARRHHLKQFGV